MLPDIVFQITQTRFVVVNKRLRVFCIGKADHIAILRFVKTDNARITATAVTAGKTVTAVQGFAVTYSVFAVKRCLSAALLFENHETASQRYAAVSFLEE